MKTSTLAFIMYVRMALGILLGVLIFTYPLPSAGLQEDPWTDSASYRLHRDAAQGMNGLLSGIQYTLTQQVEKRKRVPEDASAIYQSAYRAYKRGDAEELEAVAVAAKEPGYERRLAKKRLSEPGGKVVVTSRWDGKIEGWLIDRDRTIAVGFSTERRNLPPTIQAELREFSLARSPWTMVLYGTVLMCFIVISVLHKVTVRSLDIDISHLSKHYAIIPIVLPLVIGGAWALYSHPLRPQFDAELIMMAREAVKSDAPIIIMDYAGTKR